MATLRHSLLCCAGLLALPLATLAAPSISLSPTSLTFTGQVYQSIASQTVTVSNSGDSPLNYTITSDMFWLSVSNAAGSLAPGQSTNLLVNIATRGLDALRTYTGRLTVYDPSATNNPQAITITLTLSGVALPSRVSAWGYNSYGQTHVPMGLTNVISVSGGDYHSLALCADGRVVAWGNDSSGQTNVPTGLTNAVAIAGGYEHSLALRSDGRVIAWGNPAQTNVPTDMTNVTAIAAGSWHSLALRADGTVVAWGTNASGQLDVPIGLTNVVGIAAGTFHSVALRANGTVVAWGNSIATDVPNGLTNVVAVACGYFYSLALRADGTVIGWGDNENGVTNVDNDVSNAVALAPDDFHAMALRADRTIVAWGDGSTPIPAGLTNVMALASGGQHYLAVTPAQSLVVSSANTNAIPGVSTNLLLRGSEQWLTTDAAINDGGTQYVSTGWVGTGDVPASGTSNGVGITVTQDSSITWQWNTNYWLGLTVSNGGSVSESSGWYPSGSNILITASNNPGYTFLGWFGDTEDCTPNNLQIAVPVSHARNITACFTEMPAAIGMTFPTVTFTGQVYASLENQTITISNSGTAALNYTITPDTFWLSVSNATGCLAANQSTSHTVKVVTRGLEASRQYTGHLIILAPSATNSPQQITVHLSLANITPPSRVVEWGYNHDGQTNVPTGLTNAVAVASGIAHSLALRANRTVVAWGYNGDGQTNVPTGLTNVIAVAADNGYSLGLQANGTVVAWGYNGDGQTNVPTGLTNIVAVAAGRFHALGLRSNGKVVAWGYNGDGQTNVPMSLTNVIAIAAGNRHSLALRTDGSVVAWGDHSNGQTNTPPELTNAVAIAAGGDHSLALLADGSVVAWGYNGYGQTNVPVGLTNVIEVAASDEDSLALRADGTLVAWGSNSHSEISMPIELTNVWAVAASEYNTLALVPVQSMIVTEGQSATIPSIVTNWPIRGSEQWLTTAILVTDGGTQFVNSGWVGTGDVPSSGTSNGVGIIITQNSSIRWCWQTNYWLDTTNTSGGSIDKSDMWVSSGSNVTIRTAVLDHPLLGWFGDTNGCTFNGTDFLVPMTQARNLHAFFSYSGIAPSPVTLSFTGQVHSTIAAQWLTLDNSGADPLNYTIESDMFWLKTQTSGGQLDAGISTSHVIHVSSIGLDPTRTYMGHLTINDPSATNNPQRLQVTLKLSPVDIPSKVITWGWYGNGLTNIPTGLTNAVAVSAGYFHTLALRANGTVTAWGDNSYGQINVPTGLSDVIAVSTKYYNSLALRSNGTVVGWGTNFLGPVTAPSNLTTAVAISSGYGHSLALRSNGTVVAWGEDYGNGITNIPPDLSNIVAVAAGWEYSLALRADGTVASWGFSPYANLPNGLTNIVAIAAGVVHSLALHSDGTVTAWTTNGVLDTSTPTGLTNVMAIAEGLDYSLVLKADGTVVGWGTNDFGQVNLPTGLTNVVALSSGWYHSLGLAPARALIVKSAKGTPSPPVGTNWVIRGAVQTCSVTSAITAGKTQYVNTGWVGTGDTPVTGSTNIMSFVASNDSTITWGWQTNYSLQASTNGSGSVTPTSGWYMAGSDVAITAAPSEYWHFGAWTGNLSTQAIASNPIVVNMSIPRTLVAQFVVNTTSNQTPETWLATHGFTNDFESASTNDPDGDGMQTWEEYVADLDPNSPTSSFVIATTSFTNGFIVRIPSSTGRVYSLDFGSSIVTPDWQPVSGQTNIPGNGGTLTLINNNPAAGGRYHRVRVALP